MLKERGAERSGYRGCLIGGVVFGLIGACLAYYFTSGYAEKTVPDMPASQLMIPILFSAVGFVAGAVVGCLVVFLFDLATRKKEQELDEF